MTSTEQKREVKTSPKRYKNIDIERVTKVLRIRADQLYSVHDRTERVIDATTAEDLVQVVLREFLEHPSGMDWDPKQGSLETFLRKVLDRRWIDRCRVKGKLRHRSMTTKTGLTSRQRQRIRWRAWSANRF